MNATKRRGRKAKIVAAHSVPALRLDTAPLYLAAAGLTFVAACGYWSALPWQIAVGLILVAAAVEFLKPKLGENLRAAVDDERWGDVAALAAAAGACVVIGAAGVAVALHAADAPARDRAAAVASYHIDLDAAGKEVALARADLAALPVCNAQTRTDRCETMTRENAPERAKRERRLERALATLAGVRAAAPKSAGRQATGLPGVGLAGKIAFGLAVDFVILAVPFASRRRDLAEKALQPSVKQVPAPPAIVKVPDAVLRKINDGGWAVRRAKYGASGRKPKRALRVLAGGKG